MHFLKFSYNLSYFFIAFYRSWMKSLNSSLKFLLEKVPIYNVKAFSSICFYLKYFYYFF